MDIPEQVLQFFERHAPFDALPADELTQLVQTANLVYLTQHNLDTQLPSSNDQVFADDGLPVGGQGE